MKPLKSLARLALLAPACRGSGGQGVGAAPAEAGKLTLPRG